MQAAFFNFGKGAYVAAPFTRAMIEAELFSKASLHASGGGHSIMSFRLLLCSTMVVGTRE